MSVGTSRRSNVSPPGNSKNSPAGELTIMARIQNRRITGPRRVSTTAPVSETCETIRAESLELGETTVVDVAARLTQSDKDQLDRCECILHTGLSTFFEVGSALLTIRNKHLYRLTHLNFETYCRERWSIGRTYAWRFIGAAERLRLLPVGNTMPRPSNEFQIRPFLKLKPEAFPTAWEEVTRRARDGKVTASLVRSVVSELSSNRNQPRAPIKKSTQVKKKVLLGQILALLHEAKRMVEENKTDLAIKVLDRIEDLLFGSPESRM
jgi:hypothetical protein